MKRRVNILVSGRVQGVFFRKFVQIQAKQLNVYGWAKNLDDGRVEVVAEADFDTVEKFIQYCCKGPVSAKVENIEVIELTPDAAFSRFDIK